MSIKGVLAVGVVLSALLFVAGCGGSDDSATGSSGGSDSSGGITEVTVETGSLSKPEFIKQANQICQKTWTRFETKLFKTFEEAQNNPTKPTEPSYQQVFFETELPEILETHIDEISELGAPQGDEEEIAAFLEPLQKMASESSQDPEGFGETFLQNEAFFAKETQLADAYGLNGCLETPGAEAPAQKSEAPKPSSESSMAPNAGSSK